MARARVAAATAAPTVTAVVVMVTVAVVMGVEARARVAAVTGQRATALREQPRGAEAKAALVSGLDFVQRGPRPVGHFPGQSSVKELPARS